MCVCVFVCLVLDAIVSPSLLSNDTSGTGSENEQINTHTPFFSHTLIDVHKHTLGKPQECCVVLLEREHSPVHGLSMEHWNVRTLECQQERGW